MPDRKESGTIKKFVILAIWSNFSAQSPAIKPTDPKINELKNVNTTMWIKLTILIQCYTIIKMWYNDKKFIFAVLRFKKILTFKICDHKNKYYLFD